MAYFYTWIISVQSIIDLIIKLPIVIYMSLEMFKNTIFKIFHITILTKSHRLTIIVCSMCVYQKEKKPHRFGSLLNVQITIIETPQEDNYQIHIYYYIYW